MTAQPIEEPPQDRWLLGMFEMIRARDILVFSLDYPYWDFDSPVTAFRPLPQDLREHIMYCNALTLYGNKMKLAESSIPSTERA
ncbi:MAG: hypothetical protein M1118_11585 [Chloroflexi bacterium]|nr:hypothetical protein [Chloroflexota bacterium]